MSNSQERPSTQGPASPSRSSQRFVVRGAGYGVIEIAGPDRARWLHGLTSNEVKMLKPGEGNYALFLTSKGKMIAEAWVLCFDGFYIVISRPEHRVRVAQTLDRYLQMDDVTLKDATDLYSVVGLHGPDAEVVAAVYAGQEPPKIEGHHVGPMDHLVAVREFCWPGYLLLASPARVNGLLAQDFPEYAGYRLADERELEPVRIEHGIPRWGGELNEDSIPIEAGLEARAISYDKGCYVGQEIIARIKTYGEVAKKLWGIRWTGEGPVAPKTTFQRDAAEAGWVTSSAVSPVLGPISLAYVKRGHGEAGAEVRTAEGRIGAMAPLPFAR